MLIERFENDPLVAGEGRLTPPGFGPAYLQWRCQTEDNEPHPA